MKTEAAKFPVFMYNVFERHAAKHGRRSCTQPSGRKGGMKLTYPICCSVDVHTFLAATIIIGEYVMPHYHQKRFSTFCNGLVAIKRWLLEYDCKDVCMESIGVSWGACFVVPVFGLANFP